MHPAPVGTRITIVRNTNGHSYTVGRTYTVTYVDDSDGTLRAADESGRTGNWLRWSECRPASASDWTKIAAGLPEPLVCFLSCFDGIDDIRLNAHTVDAMLSAMPDLHERIVIAASTPQGNALIAANRPAPANHTL
jgi:hypothetical protein